MEFGQPTHFFQHYRVSPQMHWERKFHYQARNKHFSMHFIQFPSCLFALLSLLPNKKRGKNAVLEVFCSAYFSPRFSPRRKRETERGLLFVCSDKFIGCDRFFAACPERERKAKIRKIKTQPVTEKEDNIISECQIANGTSSLFLVLHSSPVFSLFHKR